MGKSSVTVRIENKLGLHARPAMMFVEVASRFDSGISVRRRGQKDTVDGKSIMQMMMLAATCGTDLEITADGKDAEQALDDLAKLVASRFQED